MDELAMISGPIPALTTQELSSLPPEMRALLDDVAPGNRREPHQTLKAL